MIWKRLLVRAPSPASRGVCCTMFDPVTDAEAHEAYAANAAACQQSNNTAELSGIIEALQFLLPHGPDSRGSLILHFLRFTAYGLSIPWLRSAANQCSARWDKPITPVTSAVTGVPYIASQSIAVEEMWEMYVLITLRHSTPPDAYPRVLCDLLLSDGRFNAFMRRCCKQRLAFSETSHDSDGSIMFVASNNMRYSGTGLSGRQVCHFFIYLLQFRTRSLRLRLVDRLCRAFRRVDSHPSS